MTHRTRSVLLAVAAAIVLFITLSKEFWVAIPIVAAVGVFLLSKGQHLGRGTTVAAVAFVGSIAFVVFGAVITLLSASARAMASLVLASGMSAIALGVVGLILSVIQLRRAIRSTAPAIDAADEPVSSP